MTEELIEAIIRMAKEDALQVTRTLLENDVEPVQILDAGRAAMQIIGQRFEAGEYFLPELIVSGDIMESLAELVKPYLQERQTNETVAKVVIGTVEGDIHDIGKDIVAFMLDINGFEVIDLGVDVPAHQFVEAAAAHQAQIVGLSGFLTLAVPPMKETISAFRRAGEQSPKIMIGGGPIDDRVRDHTGADAWGADAMEAVSIAKVWAEASHND